MSFSTQSEHNTSITTDGDYLYMYMGLPMKPMMYKIGTGVNDNTIAGKIYNERRGDKDGDIMWAHLQGKLYARRASDSEAGMVNMYDA